ncbi:MAG: hypothetical protein HDKAJFGB_00106 [Anaerolineae bacterium]|nr:hypothetical protein [Anaerolineae bacterium]
MRSGIGSEPYLSCTANAFASGIEKRPSMTPRPPVMGELMDGDEITRLSNTIAKYLPTLFVVWSAKMVAPPLRNSKSITGVFVFC